MTSSGEGDGGPMKSTWLSAAFNEIQRRPRLNEDLYEILLAFGKDESDAPGPASLDPDATDVASASVDDGGAAAGSTVDATSYLQHRIAHELLDEIDADQASMFGRRFSSVSKLLKADEGDGQEVTTKQLLRLALHRRTVQILSTSDPVLSQRKALRVRALVDFIWSQSLVLGLKDNADNEAHSTLGQLVQEQQLQSSSSPHYTQFSTGFFHATLEGLTSDFGPVHINILRIHLKRGSCRMKCVDARDICTDLPSLAEQMGAVAAISGGFFLYSEPDIELPSKRTDPVGLLVSDGSIAAPPVFGRASILEKTCEDRRSIDLDKVGMGGVTCIFALQSTSNASDHQTMELTIGQERVRCVHRGTADHVSIEENECGFSIVGSTVVSRQIASTSTMMPVPLAGFVLVFPASLIPKGINVMCDDLAIGLTYAFPPPLSDVRSAMAGGPMFFSDENGLHSMDLPSEDFRGSAPPVTFSQDETHDHNLLPRMGVGIATDTDSGDDELVCVAVDGRNLERALGLTLQGTSAFLRSLGCKKAMNLDGGSSKRMVIWDPTLGMHKVVCLSTTEIKASNGGGNKGGGGQADAAEPSRPVHSAILFLPDNKK